MSKKRYRPACDHSGQHGLVLSGGLYSFVDSVEYTTDAAAFDQSGAITTMPGNASKYLNCLVALDNGNLFITGMAYWYFFLLMDCWLTFTMVTGYYSIHLNNFNLLNPVSIVNEFYV